MIFSGNTPCFYCDRTLKQTGAMYQGAEDLGEHHMCPRCWNQAIAAKVPRAAIQYFSREQFMARLIEYAEKEEAERLRKIEEEKNKVVAVDFKNKKRK